MLVRFQVQIKHMTWQTCLIHECPFKHAAGGVICQGASMLPTSYLHGCSFRSFSKQSCLHTTACLLICVLPATFKKFCSNKRWPVTGTSLARTATHLEQTWAIERLLPGLHAQKKQCFVLDSWWIITVPTEHCATRASSEMMPEDLRMHHDLRFGCMFLTDIRSEIHEYRPLSSCHVLPADRRNKALECWLTTLDASSATMSHAFGQTTAARTGVICQSASSKLLTSCLQGYSFQLSLSRCSFPLSVCCTLLSRNYVPTRGHISL